MGKGGGGGGGVGWAEIVLGWHAAVYIVREIINKKGSYFHVFLPCILRESIPFIECFIENIFQCFDL